MNVSDNSNLNLSEEVSKDLPFSCFVNLIYYKDYSQKFSLHLTLIIIWICVIVIKFFGNLLVVVTICRTPSLRTVTNYYITNMSLIDIVIAAVVMPFKLLQLAAPCSVSVRLFTTHVCCITEYLFMVLVFTSVFTVIIISIERYVAILHPMMVYMIHKKNRTLVIILGSWAVPMMLCIPTLLYARAQQTYIHSEFGMMDRIFCVIEFPAERLKLYIWLSFILYYFLPFCVVSFTSFKIISRLMQPVLAAVENPMVEGSSRKSALKMKHQENKRKVTKMIIVIAFLYYLSWTPFYVTQIVALHTDYMVKCQYFFTFLVLFLISFFNGMANPIVYYFMSRKIRKQMLIVLHYLFRPKPKWKRLHFYKLTYVTNNQGSKVTQSQENGKPGHNSTVVLKQYYSSL